MTKQRVVFVALVAASLVAPMLVYPVFLMKVLCMALFACAFNFLFGFVGLMSFGHAAFLGSAAYITGYSLKTLGLTPELAILAGTGFAGLLGFVIGSIAIKREGLYFSLITLALAQMVYFICVQAPFTNAEDGIQGVPRGHLFGFIDLKNTMAMYYVVLAIFLIGFGVVYRTIHSPFGAVLKAIRENEPRAISLGYNVARYKLLAFVISATIAGLAGATKTVVFQLASLSDVHWSMSGEPVLMSLVGGVGTVMGPLVGAAIIVSMEHYLAEVGSWSTIIMGIIFVLCVLTFRAGVVGTLNDWLAARKARRQAGSSPKGLADERPASQAT